MCESMFYTVGGGSFMSIKEIHLYAESLFHITDHQIHSVGIVTLIMNYNFHKNTFIKYYLHKRTIQFILKSI